MRTTEYEELILKNERLLNLISEKKANEPYAAGKWKRKMMLGHLIDSAINNIDRFIEGQLKDNLLFEGYDDNKWVEKQNYSTASWDNLIILWTALNKQIIHIISTIPEDKLTKETLEHGFNKMCFKKLSSNRPATLEYLITDYYDHLEHHLDQILS